MLKHIDRVTVGIIGGAVGLIMVVIVVGIGLLGGTDDPGSGERATSESTVASSAGPTTTSPADSDDEKESSSTTTPPSTGLPPTTGPLPELPKLDDEVRQPTVSFLEAGVPLADQVDAGALAVATADDPCKQKDFPRATDVVNEVASTPDGVLGELWQAQGADLALLESQCQDSANPDPELVSNILTRAHLIQARKDQL